MKLFWSPRSPYVRMVVVTAHEVGLGTRIELHRTLVDIHEPHLELLAHNPLCKIPTLVLGDGTALYDTRVICEYLDERQGQRLLPAGGPERLVELRRQALGIGLIDLLLSWLLERNRPEDKRDERAIAALRVKYDKTLDELAHLAPVLAASPFRMGHVAIGTALSYSDFRFGAVEWRDGRAGLADWHSTFVERPSYKADPFFDEIAAAEQAKRKANSARA